MLKKSAGKPCRFLNVEMVDKYGYYMYNICMETIRFEWDENKNIINQEKHGVSFEEAKTVFYDEFALLEYDKKTPVQRIASVFLD